MEPETENATSWNRMELLQIADAVARDKSIERETVIAAMEEAIQKAARSKYGHEHDIRAEIDTNTGEIRIFRCLEVVDELETESTQILLSSPA